MKQFSVAIFLVLWLLSAVVCTRGAGQSDMSRTLTKDRVLTTLNRLLKEQKDIRELTHATGRVDGIQPFSAEGNKATVNSTLKWNEQDKAREEKTVVRFRHDAYTGKWYLTDIKIGSVYQSQRGQLLLEVK